MADLYREEFRGLNAMYKIKPLSLIALLLFTCTVSKSDNKKKEQPRVLFGVKLHRSAVGILKEVEEIFGCQIKEERVGGWRPSLQGESIINSDGIPIIRVRDDRKPSELTLVHEMFHLKEWGRGEPTVTIRWDKRLFKESRELTTSIVQIVNDAISHYKMYPALRKLGFTPERENLMAAIQGAKALKMTPEEAENADQVRGAATYFKAVIESNKLSARSKIAHLYKKKGLDLLVQSGEKMISHVLQGDLQKPEGYITVLLSCLNRVFERILRFDFSHWEVGKPQINRAYISALAIGS
ncbi:MAG TPA: hypothetical protein VNH22_10110 [Blastocatellia bacterium]|jgi:hypothetical protein|nr:hypothetical protein [Blastocatellia bacterium]